MSYTKQQQTDTELQLIQQARNHTHHRSLQQPSRSPPYGRLQTALQHRLRAQVLHDVLARILWVPYCAICMGPVVQLALTNSCLHQFCFDCIAQWTTIAPECPLCRNEYQTVLCDIRTADEYRELQIVDATITAKMD